MIITIDRQCGCGGHRVGVLLAEKLGLELYDKKKLLEESKKIGKFEENSDFFDEKSVNSLLYSIAMNYGEKKSNDEFIQPGTGTYQRKICCYDRTMCQYHISGYARCHHCLSPCRYGTSGTSYYGARPCF